MGVSLSKNLYFFEKGVAGAQPPTGSRGGSPTFSPGIDAGRVCPRALSTDAYKWSQKVGAGRTDRKRPRLQWTLSQPSIHSPSPRGRGLGFRQGCRDRTPKGFAGRKAHKAFLQGQRTSTFLKKQTFSTSCRPQAQPTGFFDAFSRI